MIDQDLINLIFAKYSDFNARGITKMMLNGVFSQLVLDIIFIIFNNSEYLEIFSPSA